MKWHRDTRLERLGLRNNALTGSIPAALANLTKLRGIHLQGNNLTGCVPVALRSVRDNDLHRLRLPDCGS